MILTSDRATLAENKPEKIFFSALALTLSLPDQICNPPYCPPYNSYNISSESLLLDQLIIPKLIFFFILITYLVDIVLILSGEILSWSLMGVKGLSCNSIARIIALFNFHLQVK